MKFKLPNKKYIFGGISAALVTAFFVIGLANVILTSNVSKRLEATAKNSEEASAQVFAMPKLPSEAIYRLYECGGKIGIYDAKTDILIDIIDVLASTLPKADRQALKKGIDIYTFNDLAKIIDDFSS